MAFIVLSVPEGDRWDRSEQLPAGTEALLRRRLGAITARLHTLAPEDGRFGYPATESGLSAADWRTAFTAMADALLDDADHWRSPLDVPPQPDAPRCRRERHPHRLRLPHA
ncbi:hypothetical protein ACIGZJ_25745 [Kitasatospora sp. NPDC052868]|uniref:hypothetical protein n=1 Tax=Kitasatospora sp. NPDC052868 TaxID=3364060 RepID=UPI0037C4F8E0